MDTGDTTRDLAFSESLVTDAAGSTESMIIQPGRAKVYINKTTAQFAYAATNDSELTIEVPAGASNLAAAAVFSVLSLALISF